MILTLCHFAFWLNCNALIARKGSQRPGASPKRQPREFHGLFHLVGDGCNAIGSTCLVPVSARGTANAKAADDFRTVLDGNAARIGENIRQVGKLWSSAVRSTLDKCNELARAREAEDRAHGDDCIGLPIGES